MFVPRPKQNDTEDDLLEQQEKFLKHTDKNSKRSITKEDSDHDQHHEIQSDNHDIINLDFKILEREIPSKNFDQQYLNTKKIDSNSEVSVNNGFPEAPNLFMGVKSKEKLTSSQKSLSLYAQRCLKNKTNVTENSSNNSDINRENSAQDLITGIGLGSENWKKDMVEIKNENQKLLDNMSRDEIEKLRQEIVKKLTPKTVEFLKSKKFPYRSDNDASNKKLENAQFQKQVDTSNHEEDIEEKIPIKIEEIKSRKYVHMDLIEKEKLSWMGNIKKSENESLSNNLPHKPDQNNDTRFDFEGELIDTDHAAQVDVHQGLHHHGDEPELPGYTINELFIYLQSSLAAQKQIALKAFEKIITKAYRGYYDSCFNTNLIEYLLKDSQLVLVVRTCLDETSDTVWKCAISTMKALICNTVFDEIFLDRGYLILEDYLSYGYQIDLTLKPTIDVQIDEECSDQQYLMYDVIGCLLNRTLILERFAYLLQNQLHDSDLPIIEDILDILIRMARHSKESSEKILNNKDLLESIMDRMIHKNQSINQIRMSHAKCFKLLRVCITSIMTKCNENRIILPPSLMKLFNKLDHASLIDALNFAFLLVPEDARTEIGDKTLPMVSIEALRLWLKLLTFGCSDHNLIKGLLQNFFNISPFLLKILNYSKKLQPLEPCSLDSTMATFDFQFTSCILMLVKIYYELLDGPDDYANVYCFELYDIAMRWFTIIHQESLVPDFDCNICLLILVEFILKHIKGCDQFTHLVLTKLMTKNPTFIRKLCRGCMKNSSANLLQKEISGKYRDSGNLPSFGSIYFKGMDCVPILKHDSPICLLQSLISMACQSNYPMQNESQIDTIRHLFEYIDLINQSIQKNMAINVFDLIEINIVAKACLVVQRAINSQKKEGQDHQGDLVRFSESIFKFALKIHVLNDNQIKNEILQQCLFNNLPCEDSLMRQTYLTHSKFNHLHWIFDPLLNQVNVNDKLIHCDESNKISLEELCSSLIFIEYLYDNFNDHLAAIECKPNIMFEILCTVFLIDEDYFFDQQIQKLLKNFFTKFFKRNSTIYCSTDDNLPRLGNIINVFNKFCDQFVNSSYYDPLFCNYLFVFLQPKCSKYFRNHFLSEYSCSIKLVNFKLKELLIPLDMLLEPIESDLEIMEVYLKTLLSEQSSTHKDSVLHCFLIHHLHQALYATKSLQQMMDDDQNEELKLKRLKFQKLRRSIEMCSDSQLKKNIKNYSHISIENGLITKI